MPPRSRRSSGTCGFSLLEAVIVIAIMAILATAMTPLLMRSLAQQRTQKTRDMVRTAYEALVGARDRGLPNLMTDVGFIPPVAMADLRILAMRNPAGGWPAGPNPPAYPALAAGFTWGWNGPYWTAPIQSQAGTNGLPADAWGRPFRWATNQVQSAGADGVFGNADDVVYPPAPAATPASAQLQITIERQLPPPATTPPSATYTIQVVDRSQQALRTRNPAGFTFPASGTGTTAPLTVMPGAVYILLGGSATQSQTITLAPGESRIVLFRINT